MLGHAAVDGEVEGEEEADDDIEDEADAGGHLVIQQRHKAGQGHFIVELVTNIRKLCFFTQCKPMDPFLARVTQFHIYSTYSGFMPV